MRTLSGLHAQIRREQSYFASRGCELKCRLWPPAVRGALEELERELAVTLPTAYADFLQITNGLWLDLTFPATENIGKVPLVSSAGLYESGMVLRATRAVRDLLEWVDCTQSSSVIAMGGDGMIGDCLALCVNGTPAYVVSCTNDQPGDLFEPYFRVAPSFEDFVERFLGASLEGRADITFWMD